MYIIPSNHITVIEKVNELAHLQHLEGSNIISLDTKLNPKIDKHETYMHNMKLSERQYE